MYFQVTPFNLITLILLGLTVWVIVARTRGMLESNWPLVYYLLVLVYWKVFEGGLSPYWVYAGLVSAVLLRFEFMGGIVLTFVRVIEYIFLGYVIVRGLQLIFLWPW
jgi:riboflavin transporter FmnP